MNDGAMQPYSLTLDKFSIMRLNGTPTPRS